MTRSSFLTVFQGVVMLVALASSTRVQARTVSIDFMQGQNATVKGVYVTKEFWFELSEDWEFPQPAALELRFSHTPILVRQLSTLSVQVNGSAVDSIYLDNTNLRNAVLNLPIPGRFLKGGMNVLTLVIKMRSELKDLCDDVHNPALWTLLERESRLVVNYNEKEIKPDLQGFPQDYANPDLLYTEEKERVHAVVLTSASPSQAEMELVGALAVALGQGIGVGSGEFRVVPIDQADPADVRSRQVIVAGGPDVVKRATGGPWKVPAPLGERGQEPGGVLMEVASPLNPSRRLLAA
nr:cellulose biosynthesis cyclic di-GMP-binding regulatory protein BcsB [Myxococcota bacterium]